MTHPSGTARPDLSVIMVNWNTLSLTAAALTSLRAMTSGIEYEVFVFDNGSTRDATVTEIPARFPWVKFRALGANHGFAYPNNLGIAESTGRYVLLLNNDTIQTENALGKSVAYMDAHPEVGALGILHRNNDAERTVQPSVHRFPDPWDEILTHLGVRRSVPPPPPSSAVPPEADVDWVVGSFLLIRRACLDEVGPLDERYFLYDEDIDWCVRAHACGWRVRFWPGAEMIHLGNGTMAWMKDKTFMHYRSHLTYLSKTHSRLVAAAFYAAISLRLSASTVWQAGRLLTGRGSVEEVRSRFKRQIGFWRLDASRTGV